MPLKIAQIEASTQISSKLFIINNPREASHQTQLRNSPKGVIVALDAPRYSCLNS